MITNIRKRDGRIENFDKQKIVNAIIKAMNHNFVNDIKCAEAIADKIENLNVDVIEIEEVDGEIENNTPANEIKAIINQRKVSKVIILFDDGSYQEM